MESPLETNVTFPIVDQEIEIQIKKLILNLERVLKLILNKIFNEKKNELYRVYGKVVLRKSK